MQLGEFGDHSQQKNSKLLDKVVNCERAMVDVYLALDCTLPLLSSGENSQDVDERKLKLAVDCLIQLARRMLRGENSEEILSINLLRLGPEIEMVRARSEADVQRIFNRSCITAGPINFTALRDFLFQQHSTLLNFELVLVMDACNYQWIPNSFRLPCPVYFVAVAESRHRLDARLMADFEAISSVCWTGNSPDNGTGFKPMPLLLDEADSSIASTLNKLVGNGTKRTQKFIAVTLSPTHRIKLELMPGLPFPHCPLAAVDPECLAVPLHTSQTTGIDQFKEQYEDMEKQIATVEQEFHVVGFTPSARLLQLPSFNTLHHVQPQKLQTHKKVSSGEKSVQAGGEVQNERNLQLFHLLAEALGTESQLAVLQHQPTGVMGLLRPVREDAPADSPATVERPPWRLCLHLIPASTYHFHFAQSPEALSAVGMPLLADEKGTSYRPSTTATSTAKSPNTTGGHQQRTYWAEPQGAYSDLIKLNRLLKKADRVEMFHAEMRRIALYAMACGYHSFAGTFADLLEQRCTLIAEENKKALHAVLDALRGPAGFRAICQPEIMGRS